MSLRDVFVIKEAAPRFPTQVFPPGTRLYKAMHGKFDPKRDKPTWFAPNQHRAEEYFDLGLDDAETVQEFEITQPLTAVVLHRKDPKLKSPFDQADDYGGILNDPLLARKLNTHYMTQTYGDFGTWATGDADQEFTLDAMNELGYPADAIYVPEMDDLCIFHPPEFVKLLGEAGIIGGWYRKPQGG